MSQKQRWSVQVSERANLCKIVAQGEERQAGVQRSVQEAGEVCVWGERRLLYVLGRREGGANPGAWRGRGRVVRGAAGGGI